MSDMPLKELLARTAPPPREPRDRSSVRQCNVELPADTDDALRAHLAITRVPKRDFVLLAVRNELERQRELAARMKAEAASG